MAVVVARTIGDAEPRAEDEGGALRMLHGAKNEGGHCRIVIPTSPPGVYPTVEFQDGDLKTKSLMVTRRRRDLDRFGPRCA